ncbi:hypothetical protein EDD18DRAFT_1109859 [Armillaria luteobubalina]|uniref:Uncharacterized protein n=1 Tax=Armillaria luteobubalina TaxID=153913 RepID=A0AA39UHU3_9AGAR|nr:hypothetical protein EDD18DRAFT_1109859 [Armillaria luteobubalina]
MNHMQPHATVTPLSMAVRHILPWHQSGKHRHEMKEKHAKGTGSGHTCMPTPLHRHQQWSSKYGCKAPSSQQPMMNIRISGPSTIARMGHPDHVVKPQFIVITTRHSGEPNIPVFKDQDAFKGQL